MEERPRSTTAWSVDEVRVTTVTRDEFVDMLLHRPSESVKYIQSLFERLRNMNAQIGAQDQPFIPSATAPLAAKVTVLPLSRKSTQVVPESGLEVNRFPFRVGRASLKDEEDPLDVNDLYLADTSPFNVSRNHFLFDQTQTHVVLRDRGSHLGTIVNGEFVGGHRTVAEAVLVEGENDVIVGSKRSPFHFRVNVEKVSP